MSDLDEGRDLHAAFGTLLADEPAAPWSVSDDVSRGRALQRRRRTRAGAGIGLAAAAVMVFGVFGPLRPQAAVVQPGGTPPTVPGVPQAWFDNITPALLDRITAVVDWEQSRVDGSAADGFLADLTLVPVSVTMNGSDRTVELVPGSTTTGRLTLQWIPGGSAPGPALVRCTKSACPEQGPTSVVGGPVDLAATAGPDAAFPEGTVIIDRQYPQGLLEMVVYPEPRSTTSPASGFDPVVMQGVIASEFLSALGNPLTGPPGPGPDASFVAAQRAIVEPYLNKLGFTVAEAHLSTALVDDGRTRIEYTVSVPTNGVGSYTASVIVSTFSTPSGPGYPSGSYLEYCTGNACSDVQVFDPDCAQGAICMTTYWATADPKANPVLAAADGMAMARWTGGTAVEVLVGVPECLTCEPIVTGDTPILTKDQGIALAAAVGRPDVFVGPSPSVTPTPTPTPSSDDPVTALLEGYGFRVVSMVENEPRLNATRTYTVDLNRKVGTTATLSLTPYQGSRVGLGAERIDVAGTVLAGCTSATCDVTDAVVCTTTTTTCASNYRLSVPCPAVSCLAYWAATTRASYPGVYAGTLAMFWSDGRDGAEAVVGLPTCPACGGSPGTQTAFLTVEQTQAVLQAFGFPRGGTVPGPSATPVSARPCTPDQVKIVPAVDSTGGATGERSFALEVYARNPGVSCTVDGFPSATLLVGADPAPGLTYTPGDYGFPNVARGVSVGVDESNAAVFVVAKFRCDSGTVGQADKVAVTLPGSSTPVVVELPPGLAPELCTGTATDAGHEVWVSFFKPREGGVA